MNLGLFESYVLKKEEVSLLRSLFIPITTHDIKINEKIILKGYFIDFYPS